jgi:hypothetical protein
MLYQLPNGKVITLTVEEYLDLTDNDIQYLMALNAGDYANSPWSNSVIKTSNTSMTNRNVDKSIDYYDDEEDKSHGDNPGIEEVYLDDLPDLPDTELLD